MSARSYIDQNNPNRDLSDPNWISVEGARLERMARSKSRFSTSEHDTKKIKESNNNEKLRLIKKCLASDMDNDEKLQMIKRIIKS